MFRIKICGITTAKDGLTAARAGADAIGLNFFEGSRRFVTRDSAAQILEQLPSDIARVGVFVNAEPNELLQLHDQLRLDWIQLHGDEPPELLRELGPRRVIRAFRCRDSGLQPALEYLARCLQLGSPPQAVLLDAYQPGSYGGTGRTLDWPMLRDARAEFSSIPIVLAGGLTADNVAQAIETAVPDAVDTASGVENEDHLKDAALVGRFVAEAARAFATLA